MTDSEATELSNKLVDILDESNGGMVDRALVVFSIFMAHLNQMEPDEVRQFEDCTGWKIKDVRGLN